MSDNFRLLKELFLEQDDRTLQSVSVVLQVKIGAEMTMTI